MVKAPGWRACQSQVYMRFGSLPLGPEALKQDLLCCRLACLLQSKCGLKDSTCPAYLRQKGKPLFMRLLLFCVESLQCQRPCSSSDHGGLESTCVPHPEATGTHYEILTRAETPKYLYTTAVVLTLHCCWSSGRGTSKTKPHGEPLSGYYLRLPSSSHSSHTNDQAQEDE